MTPLQSTQARSEGDDLNRPLTDDELVQLRGEIRELAKSGRAEAVLAVFAMLPKAIGEKETRAVMVDLIADAIARGGKARFYHRWGARLINAVNDRMAARKAAQTPEQARKSE